MDLAVAAGTFPSALWMSGAGTRLSSLKDFLSRGRREHAIYILHLFAVVYFRTEKKGREEGRKGRREEGDALKEWEKPKISFSQRRELSHRDSLSLLHMTAVFLAAMYSFPYRIPSYALVNWTAPLHVGTMDPKLHKLVKLQVSHFLSEWSSQ